MAKADVYIDGQYWGSSDADSITKTLRKQGYKVTVTPQAGTTNLMIKATKKKKNPGKSKSLASTMFIPVKVIGDTLVARVTNPSQKRSFKTLVGKLKRALR